MRVFHAMMMVVGVVAEEDGDAAFLLQAQKIPTTTSTTTDPFPCESAHLVPNPPYNQLSLTSGSGGGEPKYGGQGSQTGNLISVGEALAYCKAECAERRPGCTGFFFTKHGNGHEICNLYSEALNVSNLVPPQHAHQKWIRTCIMQTTTTSTTTDPFPCESAYLVPNPPYNQLSLTSGSGGGEPKYGGQGSQIGNLISVGEALAYCKAECAERRPGCTGFFFTKHGNGHEICNLYSEALNVSHLVPPQHAHQKWIRTCIMQTTTTTTPTTGTTTTEIGPLDAAAGLVALDSKCHYGRGSSERLFRLTGQASLEECQARCLENPRCKFYSWTGGGKFAQVCMGCHDAQMAQKHTGFSLHALHRADLDRVSPSPVA